MNKTRRRAIQKHRAKDKKFSERRKEEQEQSGAARARAQIQPATPRPRSTGKQRPEAETTELQETVANEA